MWKVPLTALVAGLLAASGAEAQTAPSPTPPPARGYGGQGTSQMPTQVMPGNSATESAGVPNVPPAGRGAPASGGGQPGAGSGSALSSGGQIRPGSPTTGEGTGGSTGGGGGGGGSGR